jgi:hypothetical protein
MKLNRWRHLLDNTGPFATVSLDAWHSDPGGSGEVRLRWEASERDLADRGAPKEILEALAPVVVEPTGKGGRAGRFVVAAGSGADAKVLVNAVLPDPPARQESYWGPGPQLMPAVRALNAFTPYLLVKIDRAGADIELHGGLEDPTEYSQVDGDNDDLHKVAAGGTSQLRLQHRVEDSIERNATEVSQAVARLQRRHHPAVILLTGDERAANEFVKHAAAEITAVTVDLHTGGRAADGSHDALETAVTQALDAHRRQVEKDLIDRFRQAEGRQDNAVESLADVVDVLRRGQAEEVLLHDDASSTRMLWVGELPLQIGMHEAEVRAMGVEYPQRVRADMALSWAALATDTGITLLDEEVLRLNDGIGALLRYSDRSTPKESVPSMPGHGEAGGGEPVT